MERGGNCGWKEVISQLTQSIAQITNKHKHMTQTKEEKEGEREKRTMNEQRRRKKKKNSSVSIIKTELKYYLIRMDANSNEREKKLNMSWCILNVDLKI